MSNGESELPIVGEWYWIVWANDPHKAVVIASGNDFVGFRTDHGIDDVRRLDAWKHLVISRADKQKPWWKIW